ncbi:hypothetical protein D3C78_1298700 [compost metagenome]
MQRVHFIFQRLERVIALFFGAGMGVSVCVWDLPLFGYFAVFFEAFSNERREHFVDAVNGRPAVNMAGDLRNNLRRYRRRRGD